MFLLRLGATGVHRTGMRVFQKTQCPVGDEAGARAGRDLALGTTPSARRSSSCAGASHHPQIGAEPSISGLSRPEVGPAHVSETWISSHSQVSE